MVKFCLKIGLLDKKLILILISTIFYFIMEIIEHYAKMSPLQFILDSFYARAISYILLIIVPTIQKYRNKDLKSNEKYRTWKRIALDLFYIYLTYLFFL